MLPDFFVVLPLAAGLVTFGFTYFAITKQRFDTAGWDIGLAFVAAATAACFGLVVADVIEELPATLLLLASLFVGGRVLMTQRGRHD